MVTSLLSTVVLLVQSTQPATAPTLAPSSIEGKAIAQQVMSAAGADVWPSVTRIRFTFNVEREGKLATSVKHDWDLRAGTDLVTEGDKTRTAYFPEKLATVRLTEDAMKDHEAAWKRWTNDAYWLLMPLKLGDAGVKFGPVATTRDNPPSRAMMTMSFEQVGLTPGDQYDLSIDLRSRQVTHWVYRPGADRKTGFTWENYQNFNGLVLSTEHKSDDGKVRIYFTDVDVRRE